MIRPLFSSISVLSAVLAVSAQPCRAQVLTEAALAKAAGITAAGSTDNSGPAGIVPSDRGFNASLSTASQHDSSAGWSAVATPNVAYRFNQHFSMDVGTPIFMYINVDANVGTKAKPVYQYETRHGVPGDTTLAFHADADGDLLSYNGTFALGLPSGNTAYGLGAGQATFNLNNHLEKSLGPVTPNVEIGYGDTSSLVERRLKKSFVSVGPLAHFQAGASLDLPLNMSFEADLYEELPLSADTIYSTTGKGKKKVTTSTNAGPAEDNGLMTSLDIPLNPHATFSGSYNHSIRDQDDTVGFSLTFLLKAPPRSAALAE